MTIGHFGKLLKLTRLFHIGQLIYWTFSSIENSKGFEIPLSFIYLTKVQWNVDEISAKSLGENSTFDKKG